MEKILWVGQILSQTLDSKFFSVKKKIKSLNTRRYLNSFVPPSMVT